jgi:dTDP-4-amino-4,6-dideoxygalactose transaminase
MNRRNFLSALVPAASFASADLAIMEGGQQPAGAAPFPPSDYPGTQFYDDKERQQLIDVLERRQPFRWYGPGRGTPEKVATFEKELAARMQTKFALAVTSGSAALVTSLAALGVGPGDEVILPAWTWWSCYNAIILHGALPVFAELDDSLNLDPADVERKITPQTKVIMAVHLLGSPCDMDPLLASARRHGIKVLEDCAQSVGAGYKGKPLGSLGDIGMYSMQIAKNITAGEGGAVVTNDPRLFERASRFHDLGILRPPHAQWAGQNANREAEGRFPGCQFRMSEFTGGVLVAQLRKLDEIVGSARAVTRQVYAGVRGLNGLRLRRLPDPDGDNGTAVVFRFADRQQRDRFREATKTEGVPVSVPGGSVMLPVQPHIVRKVTNHPAWPSFQSARGKAMQYGPSCCPKTIELMDQFASIAIGPKFTGREADAIVAAVRKVYPRIVNA